MNVHEEVRGLLALSAAGLLEPEQERLVRQHADTCIACRAELQEFGQLAAALGTLPAPVPPIDLAARTQARVMADRERREAYVLSVAAALCAGTLAAAAWFGLEPYFSEWV